VPCLQLFTPPGASAPSHLFSGSAGGAPRAPGALGSGKGTRLPHRHRTGSTPDPTTRPTNTASLQTSDGGVAIWAAGGEWEHLKMMKGHRGGVNALSVHPSGRLALSVAHDKQLRMWDLLR
jgi:WD40 repeat protein